MVRATKGEEKIKIRVIFKSGADVILEGTKFDVSYKDGEELTKLSGYGMTKTFMFIDLREVVMVVKV